MNKSASNSMLEVVNPYSLDPIGEVKLVDWPTIDGWLNVASQLHKQRAKWLPAHQRIAILKKTAQIMQGKFDELAFQIANEGGKPLIDAKVEVTRAIDGVELCIKELSHLTGHEIPMDLTAAGSGRMAFTTREPIGPVVAVSAFNHPLNLIVHQVGPAIATGCPVLVKPASATPLSCQAFVHMLYEAGLPEEWCRFAPCKSDVAEQMVTDSRVAFFSFIGSGAVGWRLKSKLAPGTRCALEHGGVAPVIVDETANVDAMIPALVKGGFYHSGQVCVSVQKIYVPEDIVSSVAQAIADKASQLKVGNAIQADTECGPLVNPNEVERVDQWVNEAVAGGAKVLCGANKLGKTAYAPTVLLNPPKQAKISTQEVFGPVVCVYGTDSLSSAIEQANSLPVAFQAAVFTQKLNVALRCVREIDATAVMVNDHTAFRVDWMPFGGRRQSGYGMGGIGHTMRDMTQEKMAVIKL
ncbi:aldehyde dehydrogenase family protein [Limnobacter parvus]|uniref:Aldehyde dehydrogenase family protein n=1 Tax=Limnobacter parvus TaxID=2939690 RepID=A0ABT1XF90_9BURK|nr:aldehyde dehydrogenase family protein [Limnobacter parvus]MCR2745263.1 aldehyde dehydrogenase family protein [Limnobacter parvus]